MTLEANQPNFDELYSLKQFVDRYRAAHGLSLLPFRGTRSLGF